MADKISMWINSGEYKSDIAALRTEIMRKAAYSNTEASTATIFETSLYYLIRHKTDVNLNFSKEQQVDNIKHKFSPSRRRVSDSGRVDAVVNNLIIEYKHKSKLNTEEQFKSAVSQTVEYLEALYYNEKIKYDGILTDGVRICYFQFIGEEIRHSALAPLADEDIDTLVRALLYNSKKRLVATNIFVDFGIDTNSESFSKSLATELFDILVSQPTVKTKMLYEEWQSLMHLSIYDNGKGNDIEKRRQDLSLIFDQAIDNNDIEYKALYALQTTYAIIVKLIACKVIEKIEYNQTTNFYHDLTNVTNKNLQAFFEKMEDGYSYRSNNIYNLLEGDFFSWYSDKKQWNNKLYKITKHIIKIIDDYSSFSFNIAYQPIDIFKDLYMSIIPRSVRHSMGEYFTPQWIADYVITESKQYIKTDTWKAIDPCCGSGIFIMALIKHIVGDVNLKNISLEEKHKIKNKIINSVFGIDINPLAVLSARVGYFLALHPLGDLNDIEIPVYLGDSAIMPTKHVIDGIDCYNYVVSNEKKPLNIVLPAHLVEQKNFGHLMSELQACVKTGESEIVFEVLKSYLTSKEKKSHELLKLISTLAENLVYLHKNNWDGIWVRIATNFMLIARLKEFDLIVGNPPWVKWEHLPAMYANRIKELCNIKHIFSNDGGQFGGTQLNICALIANVTASNWLTEQGVLAFLMPDSIMSQNSYEEFRNFYIDYNQNKRLYLQSIDRWSAPLRPFWCGTNAITQDFNTYYFAYNKTDYALGIPVTEISRTTRVTDATINHCNLAASAKKYLIQRTYMAKQVSKNSTAFSYINGEYDYSAIIGTSHYTYRTGVEFTPQELYMLTGAGATKQKNRYKFYNKKFPRSKYIINDMPKNGWDLNTEIIYPIMTGPRVSPFKCLYNDEYCILPYTKENTKQAITTKEMICKYGMVFNYLIKHKNIIDLQSEKSKEMHRGNEFYALSKIGEYTFAPYIVAARDNTKFCAAVIRPVYTPWGELKQTICVKHTIIIGQDIEGNYITEDEAYYISGILNSHIVISYMENTFKSNGYSLNKSNLYLPKFSKKNKVQCKIAIIAKNASLNKIPINRAQEEITMLYLKLCEDK